MQERRSTFFSNIPVVTKNIILVNILVWIASIIFPALNDYLGLHFFKADKFNIAQLITYMFMHDNHGIGHIFFNMFAVFMFGRILEQIWGPKRFLLFYIVTGIGAGIVQEITWYIDLQPFLKSVDNYILNGDVGILGKYFKLEEGVIYPDEVVRQASEDFLNKMVTIGASGAVFGILLGFGMLFPNAPLYLMFIPVPIKAKYMVIGYGILELFAGIANFSTDNVAHFAHLGGMLFAFFLIIYWKKKGVGNGFFLG